MHGSIKTNLFFCALQKSPAERGAALNANAKLLELHNQCACSDVAQTAVQVEGVAHHFVAFVAARVGSERRLLEFDGSSPVQSVIDHGCLASANESTNDDLLKSAVAVIKAQFMAPNPDELGFNIMALTRRPE